MVGLISYPAASAGPGRHCAPGPRRRFQSHHPHHVRQGLEDYFAWRDRAGRPAFSRAAVQSHRATLEAKGYSPSTINQRLAAVKKLAREAAANGWLDAETAAGIAQVAGVKQQGVRAGNWLTRAQARLSSTAPIAATLKGIATARCSRCWSAAASAAAKRWR